MTPLEAIEKFHLKKVAIVGDVMLDRYVYGSVNRISPEAPVPIITTDRYESRLGGAGNVALNLAKLGAHVFLTTVVGNDKTGNEIQHLLVDKQMGFVGYDNPHEPGMFPAVLVEKDRISTKKTRYVADGMQQLLRADRETVDLIEDITERRVIETVIDDVRECDIVIISDYGKGVITKPVIDAVLERAASANKIVIVDPKSADFSRYAGAFIITPNLLELQATTHCQFESEGAMIDHALMLLNMNNISHMLLTRGADGVTLISRNGKIDHITSTANEVVDVSGAGDTLVACLAMGLAAGVALLAAAELANRAAGIVVGKQGTAFVGRDELSQSLSYDDMVTTARKLCGYTAAINQVNRWRSAGFSVGFANGCFDMLHNGHISLLQRSKKACHRLIVAINSDASVKRLKGDDRPICAEVDRAMMLAALESVDMVVIFDEDTPLDLIKLLRPDMLFKGSEYSGKNIVGEEQVHQVIIFDRLTEHSTSEIIAKAKGIELVKR